MKWLRLVLEIAIALLLIGGGVFATTTYATSTYNAGYASGHHLGYQSGYTNGKSYGYSQGYEDGHTQGQGLGYSDGYTAGVTEGNAQVLQQIFDWIIGSSCEQSYYSGYIYFDLWKDSNGQIHYTCLV